MVPFLPVMMRYYRWYLNTLTVENSYVEYPFKVVIVIPSPVGICTVWFDDPVTSLPDSDRTGHDAGKLFKVAYWVTIHSMEYSVVKDYGDEDYYDDDEY